MDKAEILEYVNDELERMNFEETFAQRWGRLTIEFIYEAGKVKAIVKEREHIKIK